MKKQKCDIPLWVPQDAWKGFVEARRLMGKPMTEYAKKLAINKLAELQAQGYSATGVLEQSIFYAWQGLFPIRENVNGQRKANRTNAELAKLL